MKKLIKIGLTAVIALPILAAGAIRLFVDANTFRPVIESQLSAALSRKVTLGALSLSVTTGSLVADDLAIAEDPKFGEAPFFTARRLRIGVQMRELLFNRKVNVRSFEVDAPQIHLVRAEDGTWNFSTLSHGAVSVDSTQTVAALPDLPVGLITIKDGNARIETQPLLRNPQVYDHLDVKVDHFSLAKAFPFAISASLPGDSKVGISGTVGPINPQDAVATPVDAQLTIKQLDPVAAGYVDPAAGISMVADLDAHIVSDGTKITSDGKAHAEHLILLKGGRPAPNPVDISYRVGHSLHDNNGQVSDLALQTGAIAVHLRGAYQVAANEPVLDLTLVAQSIPIDSLQALLPAVGVKLPNDAGLKGGTLSANFTIKGSAKDSVILGSYEINDTELVGYDIGSKLSGIAAMAGIKTGDSTPIQISRADVRITKSGSETTNIYSVLPAVGESTGSGTVSPSGGLNFHLICKVTGAKGLKKVGVNILTKLNSTSAAAKPSTAVGIPIDIAGTAENPVITADVNSVVKGNVSALHSKGASILNKTGLSSLFKKKGSSPATGPSN